MKKPEGLQGVPLWQWGLLLMVAGPVGNVVTGIILPITGNSAADRGALFGRGLAAVLCLIAGVVMVIMHFVREAKASRGRKGAKRVKSEAGQQAFVWTMIGISLVLSISVLIFVFVPKRKNLAVPGAGVTDIPNGMKPRKAYPVSIALPDNSVFVPPNAKLTPGTRLEACWAGKWNPITTLSENPDGSLNVRWDEFGATYDCSMLRNELIIRRDVLKQFGDFPNATSHVELPAPVAVKDAGNGDPSAKPLKKYPVTISVPADSQFVPADAKLKPGTRLQACWSGNWNPITFLSENKDGNLTVRWDDFGEAFDCSMIRTELIIKNDVLNRSQISP